MIKKYKDFNEGIISKGLELLNYKVIKENDVIAKEYIDMIYEDWKKNQNILAVRISFNKGYTTLSYLISNNKFANALVEEYGEILKIELTSIHEFGWHSDITKARISVKKKGKNLVGRELKTNKLIHDKNGIGDNYDYINISQSQVDKLIEFFKKEYLKRYPKLKGSDHLNSMKVFEIDKELAQKVRKHNDEQREINKIAYLKKMELIKDKLIENSRYSEEELMDYFIYLEDYLAEEGFKFRFKFQTILLYDNTGFIIEKLTWAPNIEPSPQKILIDINSIGKLKNKKDGDIIYIVEIEDTSASLHEDEYDTDGGVRYNSDKFINEYSEVKKQIKKLVGLPSDLKIIEMDYNYETIMSVKDDNIINKFHRYLDSDSDSLIILIEQV